jgi:hypothetical protein
MPTPRPDENVVLIIQVSAPQVERASKEYVEFDDKFTRFKQELDRLITNNFSGALKMKVVMKKDQQSSILFRA